MHLLYPYQQPRQCLTFDLQVQQLHSERVIFQVQVEMTRSLPISIFASETVRLATLLIKKVFLTSS